MGIMQMLMSGGGPGAMEATGGTKSYTPTHTIHTFLTSSPFVVSSPGLVQILVVAGGGSGGPRHGGGGGAGGLIHLPGDNGSLANGTYNVVLVMVVLLILDLKIQLMEMIPHLDHHHLLLHQLTYWL